MSWHGVENHDELVDRFQGCLKRGRLGSTFLFVGPAGIGKRKFADTLAKALLCERRSAASLDPCGTCDACHQVVAGTHPDLTVVQKPADKAYIPLLLLIGDKEHRGREGLCHQISLRPLRGGHKIAIIDDADYLNQEGANCLLKTLEEPPPRSLLILIGTSEQKQLPTIRSRAQVIRFRPLPIAVVSQLLQEQGLVESADEANRLARLGRGSMQHAVQWTAPELQSFRVEVLAELGKGGWDPLQLAPLISGFVDQAGKEASVRRERFRLVIRAVADYYLQLMRVQVGAEPAADDTLLEAVQQGSQRWRGDAETAGLCADRCLQALAQVDANANQATLLDCWLDDLSEITLEGFAEFVVRRHLLEIAG